VAATNTTPSWNYLEVEMLSPLVLGDTVTVTITFSTAVSNLSFKIHDIDHVTGDWLDQVIVVAPAGYSAAKGAHVIGTGTAADPFRNSTSFDDPIESGLGDVQLSWAGPVSQVQFTYRAGITGGATNQHIGIGNISFSDCVANPLSLVADSARLAVSRGDYQPGVVTGALQAGRDN
jgi:hypothetical protein